MAKNISRKLHRPIIPGEIFNGCEVICRAGSDSNGNVVVGFKCHCGQYSSTRWTRLYKEEVKSCSCGSQAAFRKMANDYVWSMTQEERDNVFTDIVIRKLTDFEISSKYSMYRPFVGFIRRSEYARLEDLAPSFRDSVVEAARRGNGEAGHMGLTRAEVVAICTIHRQEKDAAELAATVAAAAVPVVILPPVVIPEPADILPLTLAQPEWDMLTREEQVQAVAMSQTTVTACESICDAANSGSDGEPRYLRPSAVKMLQPLTDVLENLKSGMLGGLVAPTRAIIRSSKLHNFAQMRKAMNLRAAAEAAGKPPHRSPSRNRRVKLAPFRYEATTAQTVAMLNLMAREGVTYRNIKAAQIGVWNNDAGESSGNDPHLPWGDST